MPWASWKNAVPFPLSAVFAGEEGQESPTPSYHGSYWPSPLLVRRTARLCASAEDTDRALPTPMAHPLSHGSTESTSSPIHNRVVLGIDPGLLHSGLALVSGSRHLLWTGSTILKPERSKVRIGRGITKTEDLGRRLRLLWSTYWSELAAVPAASLTVIDTGRAGQCNRPAEQALGLLQALAFALYPTAPVIQVPPGELRAVLKVRQSASKDTMYEIIAKDYDLGGVKLNPHQRDALVLAEMGVRYLEGLP